MRAVNRTFLHLQNLDAGNLTDGAGKDRCSFCQHQGANQERRRRIPMKKAVLWICVICGILVFTGCGQKNLLSDFSARCGVDLTPGKVESVSDTHGGFHGDGYLLATVCFPDGSVYEKMKTSDRWRDLPLSENLESFVYQPFDDRVSIPPIENGRYYFYDRHHESQNPYDDTGFLDRSSYNFTLAIYDADANRLYWLAYDT